MALIAELLNKFMYFSLGDNLICRVIFLISLMQDFFMENLARAKFTTLALLLTCSAVAHDFASLDQAVPTTIDVLSIAPVFDFDGDGCYPSAGISRSGQQNGGLKPSGSLSGSCSSTNFLESSNTVHRYVCSETDARYCGHIYALYFEKDQLFSGIESGHRHDWEWAAVWTTNGEVTHGTYSYHSTAVTQSEAELAKDGGGHLKYVYHKDGVSTHAMRDAGKDEQAENPYGVFVTPPIISWYEFYGDGLNNATMRGLFNSFDYKSANLPTTDANFLRKINDHKPSNYPSFSVADAAASNSNPN